MKLQDLTSNKLKSLDAAALEQLCRDIRGFLIDKVSKTGGHLASNLGVVELTVALHKVFDFPEDKLIFDVGHQSYVHKILTGRADGFGSLRQLGGLSGFPKRAESPFDVADTGHSGTSISTALGLAKGRDILGQNHHVVAVIGDGAMSDGIALEALNNCEHERLLIVLNDNEMSISKNIGGLAHHLTGLRTSRKYKRSKKRTERALARIPKVGIALVNLLRNIKNSIKYLISPGLFFESLGITYLGPVDGHNLTELLYELSRAKESDEPCLLHVVTKKGKGYLPAEENPSAFHGIGPFDAETGLAAPKAPDFSSVMGKTLCELAQDNERLAVVCPSMGDGCGLQPFAATYPARYFDVGIAEEHGVTFAAGLALSGLTPVITVYSTFLQRAYDCLIHDVGINNLHVVVGVDRAGIVGDDGETHQGVFDISYLTQIPNFAMLSPASFDELQQMVRYGVTEHRGPIAIRYPRGGNSSVKTGTFRFGEAEVLEKGHSVTIAAEGRMVEVALEAAHILRGRGYSAEVINLKTLKPLDMATILKSAKKTKFVVTLENNIARGGVGEAISAQVGCLCKIKAFPDAYIPQGKPGELLRAYGLDGESVAADIEATLRNL